MLAALATLAGGPAVSKQGHWGPGDRRCQHREFRVSERVGSDSLYRAAAAEAAELLWPARRKRPSPSWCPDALHLTRCRSRRFSAPEARRTLLSAFELASLDGLGLGEAPTGAAGGRRLLRLPRMTPQPGRVAGPRAKEADRAELAAAPWWCRF